jgi:hypothetical protein
MRACVNTASCAHEIRFDDREDSRHDSSDASRIGMFPIAQHQSRMAEDALQKKWIAWDLMLRRERGIDRVERGFVRGAEFGKRQHAREDHASAFCFADSYDVIDIVEGSPWVGPVQHVVAAEFDDDEIRPILESPGEPLQTIGCRISRDGAVHDEHVAVTIGMQASCENIRKGGLLRQHETRAKAVAEY